MKMNDSFIIIKSIFSIDSYLYISIGIVGYQFGEDNRKADCLVAFPPFNVVNINKRAKAFGQMNCKLRRKVQLRCAP